MRIDVLNTTIWNYPVTVQIFEGDDMVLCNHAGATEESKIMELDTSSWTETYLECDKENCRAIKRDGKNWEQTL